MGAGISQGVQRHDPGGAVKGPAPSGAGAPLIRRMREEDLPAVEGIEVGAFTLPWHKETFRSLLERDLWELWVAEDQDGSVGAYAVLGCVMDQGELANIAVRGDLRGQGFGAAILDHLLEVAREREVRRLFLEVRASNHPARDLYRSRGFREIGVRKGYYEAPREDARVLMLQLDRESRGKG